MKIKKELENYITLLFERAHTKGDGVFAKKSITSPTVNTKLDVVAGHGRIESIDHEKHQLRIKHDAIKAIDWPAMTMDFTVKENLDMSQLKVSTIIDFQLEQNKDKHMEIIFIEKADNQKG